MNTQVFSAFDLEKASEAIVACAAILRQGGLVAFPTETVYGLGADARQPEAIRKIFAAKGRPADNPLIVHTYDAEQALAMAERIGGAAEILAEAFWPGPLTLVLTKGAGVPGEVTAGLDTVAVRVPDHPVARALLKSFGGPIAAPSANVSGRPSPTRAQHVLNDLAGKIDAVLDGGQTGVGVESTVIDVSQDVPIVLRLGGLPVEVLQDVLHTIEVAPEIRDAGVMNGHEGKVRSPGIKYKHYAPRAPLWIVTGNHCDVREAMSVLHREPTVASGYPAFLLTKESAQALGMENDPRCFVLGSIDDLPEIARRLYSGLRALDSMEPSVIYAESFAGLGYLGATIEDRLQRAAEGRVLPAHQVIERSSR